MRKIASRRQNGELEVGFDRAESAEFLDGCGRSFLSPHEQAPAE